MLKLFSYLEVQVYTGLYKQPKINKSKNTDFFFIFLFYVNIGSP